MRNSELIVHINNLYALFERLSKGKEKLPVKLNYAIIKTLKNLRSEYEIYDEARMKLLDVYNVKDENGEPMYKKVSTNTEIAEEFIADWTKEINELLNMDIVVDIYYVDLSVIEDNELSIEDVAAFEFLLREPVITAIPEGVKA